MNVSHYEFRLNVAWIFISCAIQDIPVVNRVVELQESDVVAVRLRQHVAEVGVQDDLVHLERLGLQRLLHLKHFLEKLLRH